MREEREQHWRNVFTKGFVILFFGGGFIMFASRSCAGDTVDVCPPGFEGRKLQKGEWPLIIIGKLGVEGIGDSPIVYIDKEGNVHKYDNWRGFEGVQHPGEAICVPRKGSSIENKQHIVYSANVQTKIRTQRRGF